MLQYIIIHSTEAQLAITLKSVVTNYAEGEVSGNGWRWGRAGETTGVLTCIVIVFCTRSEFMKFLLKTAIKPTIKLVCTHLPTPPTHNFVTQIC